MVEVGNSRKSDSLRACLDWLLAYKSNVIS